MERDFIKKYKIIISLMLLLVITFISYLPSLKSDFVYDDYPYIINNRFIRTLSPENIKEIFTSSYFLLYHPLTILSFAVEYHFFKANPFIYHMTNLLLHLLNSLFVFLFLYKLTERTFSSFAGATLFALHPFHVEVVAWISERKEVLSDFFFIITLFLYLYYKKDEKKYFYYFSLMTFILALLAKPMAVTLPVILLLCDYFLQKKINRKIIIEKGAFFFIAFLFVLFTFLSFSSGIKEYKLTNILVASYGILFYLIKFIFPVKLSAFYPEPPGGVLTSWPFLLSPVIVLLLTLIIIYYAGKDRRIAFGFLFYLITVLPVIQLIRTVEVVTADRYGYLTSIGPFYLAGEFFSWLYYKKFSSSQSAKRIIIILLVFLIFILSWSTMERCKVWKNELTLWTDVIEKYEYVPIAYGNRGLAYVKLKEYDKAMEDFNRSIELYDGYTDAYNNRGLLYMELREYEKALFDFKKVIDLDPDHLEAYVNLANIYYGKGDYDRAISFYNRALEKDPYFAQAYNGRGNAYLEKGYLNKALEDYNRSININPDYTEAYNNRGILYSLTEKQDKAIKDFTKAIAISPDYINAYYNRAISYFKKGEPEKGKKDIEKLKSLGYEIDEKFLKNFIDEDIY